MYDINKTSVNQLSFNYSYKQMGLGVKYLLLGRKVESLKLSKETQLCIKIANIVEKMKENPEELTSLGQDFVEKHKKNLQAKIKADKKTLKRKLINLFSNKLTRLEKEYEIVDEAARVIEEKLQKAQDVKPKLEEQMLSLAGMAEEISNRSKNLANVYTLSIKENEKAEDVAHFFITALDDASKNNFETFVFQGIRAEVDTMNRESLKIFHAHFHGEQKEMWKDALIDYLKSKAAHNKGEIHFSTPILLEIEEMNKLEKEGDKLEKAADVIGFYLMSEVCQIKGATRIIDNDRFNCLLAHPHIQSSLPLKKGVLNQAKAITLKAIQKTQSFLLWNQFSKVNREQKEKLFQLDDAIKNDNRVLSFQEIKEEALKIGLDVSFEDIDIEKMMPLLKQWEEVNLKIRESE